MPGTSGPKCRWPRPRKPEARAMPQRTVGIDGETWEVTPSGYSTVYGKDQFGLVFISGTGPERKRRFTRYAPVGNRSPDAALGVVRRRAARSLAPFPACLGGAGERVRRTLTCTATPPPPTAAWRPRMSRAAAGKR